MGTACELRRGRLDTSIAYLGSLRDRLEAGLIATLSGLHLNGGGTLRVPNTSNITFEGVDGMALVARLEERGVLCSQVSACSSGLPEPSRTLLTMGRSHEEAFASVRFAVSVDNSVDEIDAALQAIVDEVYFLRATMGGLV
jgi:cysteine desulfurase